MKTQWWWNSSFEDLMGSLTEWGTKNPNATIVHMDWKFVAEPNADSGGNRAGYWYMIILHK